MSHDEAYAMWRLGRAIERADMTTRVLGVRAAACCSAREVDGDRVDDYDELQWMGVLRSLSGLQMYRRAVRRPIEGASGRPLPARARPLPARRPGAAARDPPGPRRAARPGRVCSTRSTPSTRCCATRPPTASTAPQLDDAMDALQVALAQLDRRIHERYLRLGLTPRCSDAGVRRCSSC